MSNNMTYKGYAARIGYDDDDGIFTGRIAGIRDGVGFPMRIPVKRATHSGNKKPPGGWSNPDTATIAGWLF